MTSLDKIKEELIDLIIEVQRNEHNDDLESFDVYKSRLRVQCLETWDRYFERLAHGYDVIIERIESDIERESAREKGLIKP